MHQTRSGKFFAHSIPSFSLLLFLIPFSFSSSVAISPPPLSLFLSSPPPSFHLQPPHAPLLMLLFLPLSLPSSLSLSLSPSLYPSLPLSIPLSLSPSLSLFLPLSLPPPLPLPLPPSLRPPREEQTELNQLCRQKEEVEVAGRELNGKATANKVYIFMMSAFILDLLYFHKHYFLYSTFHTFTMCAHCMLNSLYVVNIYTVYMFRAF